MLETTNGYYSIQEIPLLTIANKYSPPVYIYDIDKIKYQYDRFYQAFCNLPVKIKYAMKALSNINILKFFKQWGAGVDTVSIQEVELALYAGFSSQDIVFTPNCVAFSEITKAVDKGVMVNIDDLSILENFGQKYGSEVPCCIRLNPNLLAGGNPNIQTGHIDAKFGIPLYKLNKLLDTIARYNMQIVGLHMHTGSDILDANVFLEAADILYSVAKDFPNLQFIDFGSGFKVAYQENDIVTDIEDLGQRMQLSFQNFCKEYGRQLEIWFEPGKFMVSEAGYFLTRVNTVKPGASNVFIGVDSGQNHLLRPMFYNAHHEIINISNINGVKKIYSVVGYICEQDTFANNRKIAEVRENDILCFLNAGAYGFMMSSNYNSRFRPAEVMVYKEKFHLIRKRENLDDLLRNQVVVL